MKNKTDLEAQMAMLRGRVNRMARGEESMVDLRAIEGVSILAGEGELLLREEELSLREEEGVMEALGEDTVISTKKKVDSMREEEMKNLWEVEVVEVLDSIEVEDLKEEGEGLTEEEGEEDLTEEEEVSIIEEEVGHSAVRADPKLKENLKILMPKIRMQMTSLAMTLVLVVVEVPEVEEAVSHLEEVVQGWI